jgi:endonuclease-3 related protein
MTLTQAYRRLLKHFGPQYWWPASTRFEIIVGAILTQQTTWKNVEKAIKNLKRNKLLAIHPLSKINIRRLEKLLWPAGYWRQKAGRLKGVSKYIHRNYGNKLSRLFGKPILSLREELLSLKGLGPETADSIILYAADKPIFVIDAYTRRIIHRLGITDLDEYESLRVYFEERLPKDTKLYQEFHALIVALGKNYCKTKPLCGACPLRKECRFSNDYPPKRKDT